MLLWALDVLEAAAGEWTPEQAIPAVRRVVDGLEERQVRAVAVALAVEAVHKMPATPVVGRTTEERRERLRVVRRWIGRLRLEALWVVS